MPRGSRSTTERERGSAPIEFIGVGLILLVPLVYAIIALGAIQQHTLGAEAAARHAARAISLSPDADTATARTNAVVASVVREYGMAEDAVAVEVTCRPAGSTCPESGARVHVRVSTAVTLPFVPAVLGLDRLASIPVEAEAVAKMSSVWSGR